MPTISGLRRRGYTPESIRRFCDRIGVARFDSTIDVTVLENAIREHLNEVAPRRMAVLDPLKLVITNWPAGKIELVEAVNNPEDPSAGSRSVPFSGELYIEREDFQENPPPKYHRLKPGGAVRLRYGYIVDCTDVIKNSAGEVVEIRCTYDPATRSGEDSSERKVKGTIHWVSAEHAVAAEVRLYDRLFSVEDPDNRPAGQSFLEVLNADSLRSIDAYLEPALEAAAVGERFQFERQGYFSVDADSRPGRLVFNRVVGLRDTWAKIASKA
jgi:glutaminyl-tRNA synthetase